MAKKPAKKEQIKDKVDDVLKYIHKKPVESAAIAFGLGYITAKILNIFGRK